MRDSGKKSMRSLLACRRGGILVVTMLTLPVVIGMLAIVVDLGILYVAKSKSEEAAIYAAEAGMERLPDTAAAEALARKVAIERILDAGYVRDYTITATASGGSIDVLVNLRTTAFLANFMGISALNTASEVSRP